MYVRSTSRKLPTIYTCLIMIYNKVGSIQYAFPSKKDTKNIKEKGNKLSVKLERKSKNMYEVTYVS